MSAIRPNGIKLSSSETERQRSHCLSRGSGSGLSLTQDSVRDKGSDQTPPFTPTTLQIVQCMFCATDHPNGISANPSPWLG
ncbi:hypothetical protein RRG08_060590 [Elysia crispata]|uniref:Uncharacterized protein n=1 Tax=Elysia crispata TaxID=231223 RepID=A0AAE1E2L2_9GAST|nr:hypothetical protein RRG08_060590 [Elysia crispata]